MTTLLLVDDEPALLQAMCRLLRQTTYEVYTAENAIDAQLLCKSHPIDLIVCDHKMPGMSGVTLLAWVAENIPDTTRILLTGWATIGNLDEAINKAHVDRFFMKPCEHDTLRTAIQEELQKRRARDRS